MNEAVAKFELGMFLPYRLNQAAERISIRFATEYRERYGMTRPEWRALAALGSTGVMTATQIGTHSNMHKTKVSRAVRSLEGRRWLRRLQDEDDRRTEHLELTPVGRNAFEDMSRIAAHFQRELERQLGVTALRQLTLGLNALERINLL